MAGENRNGAFAGAVGDAAVAVPEGGVLDYWADSARVFGVNRDGVMSTRESSDKEARGGIWDGSSQEVFGRTDRHGFTRVICAGSPDGSEVWLVMLLGQTDGVDWLSQVGLYQGTAKLSVEFCSSVSGRVGRPTLAGNGSRLGDVADF